ncbi:Cation/H(+) antiporter 3, partial [Linum perenne]
IKLQKINGEERKRVLFINQFTLLPISSLLSSFLFLFFHSISDMSTMASSKIVWKNETICDTFPPKMSAKGSLYVRNTIDDLLSASLTLLNIQLLLIFCISNSLNFLLKRLRIPSIVGQALTGIILGPTLLGRTDFVKKKLFPHSSQEKLEVIGFIGYDTFLFLVGVKMDLATAIHSGKKALTIGLASLFLPLMFGIAILQRVKIHNADNKFVVSQISAVTGIQSFTTFAVVSQLIGELRLTNSEIGRLALSSGLVSGLSGSLLQLFISSLASNLEIRIRLLNAVGVIVAILIALFVVRPAVVSLVIKKTPSGERVNPCWVVAILAMATAYQVLFDAIRQPFIVGPFLLGLLVVPPGPPLGSSLVETLEQIPEAMFFPVFIVVTVMKADLGSVFSEFDYRVYFISLIFWTTIIKFVVCFLLALRWIPALDSVVLALIMNAKGIVDISLYGYKLENQEILPDVFSLFIISIIINATVNPMLVSFLYEPARRHASYHSRNISVLKPFSELRILACIHKPHHVVSMMKLLDTLCRTEDSAVALYVIHLLEQLGHATPMFTCHQRKPSTTSTFSESVSPSIDVVFAFNQYERKNIGFTSLQSFTSISQYKLMHEDVLTLALDKHVSMILIPFHRKWSIDGRVESEDNILRALNTRILDMAPCSVGILYDRNRRLKRRDSVATEEYNDAFSDASSLSPSLSVCMIYLGGRDDEEAISLAKRMVNDPCVHLTIIHVVSENAHDSDIEGNMVHATSHHLNVQYLKKVVNDGTDTSMLVSSMASQYDLFIVGKRSEIDMDSPQTTGLSNWSEFPELGVIGDLLASNDVQTRGSVLVVQQQKKLK